MFVKESAIQATGVISCTESLVTSDRFTRFFDTVRSDRDSGYLSLCVPFENIDPLTVLELNGNTGSARFFWERPDHEMAMAAGNRVTLVKSKGRDRFRSISDQCNALLSKTSYFSEVNHSLAGAYLVGGFSFFDQELSGAWSSLGNASFFLPEWLLIRDCQFSILNITRKWHSDEDVDELRAWYVTWMGDFVRRLDTNMETTFEQNDNLTDTKKPGGTITSLTPKEDQRRWTDQVEQARSLIREHRFKKIVLARELRLRTDQKVSATQLIHFLRSEYPSCYSFLYQLNGQATFLGSTPEKLLSLQSQYVKTEAMAGSMSRGNTATQDTIYGKKLLESQKNLEEHAYVLNAIKEKLYSLTNSLEHTPRPIIKKYANIQHLCTPVAASLTNEMNAVDILARLHPTPAVGGYPEIEAVNHIQEMEQLERGWYAGPIGWFNTHRRAEFSVAIRSGLIRQNHIRFFAGCGIVQDSDPETEWKETDIKFIPMQKGLEYALK